MEHKNIRIVPENCPEDMYNCVECVFYGGVEDGMVRCFQDEENNNLNN